MANLEPVLSAAQLMHRIDQCDGVLDRGLLDDAVAQVEDVAGAAAGLIEDLLGAAADFFGSAEQHERVEVALNGPVVADRLPGVIEPHASVDADHRAAGLGEERQQGRIAGNQPPGQRIPPRIETPRSVDEHLHAQH